MTVERLHAVLSRVGPPDTDGSAITPREIAEILWLAAQISDDPAPAATTPVAPVDDGEADPAQPSSDECDDAPRPWNVERPPVPAPAGAPRELYPPQAAPQEGTHAGDVLAPTAPMLDRPLAVQRALRPLKRRVPDRRTRILDEHATAARIADRPLDERPWVPVMVEAPERWLSLVLVVDDGPSMRLWRPLARELHETFVRLGAFRDLRVCRLVGTDNGAGIATSRGTRPRDAATLVDPSGRQVVLVLSDCSSSHWWNGGAGRALHLWSRTGPVAILQPLAERLWRRTAAPTAPGDVVATRPCAPNLELRFTSYDGAGDTRPGSVPVPVLECSPDWLADWATLLTGGGARPAAMTYVSDRPRRDAEPVRQERELPIRERVRRFASTASPEAADLAAHVAVSFPVLPVMRLIQQQVLRTSHPGHLAEVLLSGLLRPIGDGDGRYDFVPGAREELLASLPRSESWHTADVLTRVSEEIELRAGTAAETFRAYLPADDGTGNHAIGPDGRPFALVSGEAIRLLSHTPLAVGSTSEATAPRPGLIPVQAELDPGPGEEVPVAALPELDPEPASAAVIEEEPTAETARFLRLIGAPDAATLDVERLRGRHGGRRFLQVPFAEDDDGRPIFLDLKQAAHGLCVGATGSGKSELLRTFVLALAATHAPDEVGLMLVDYKGGATFAPFAGLPHITGMITNLAEDGALVERAAATLAGELRRRERLLRDAGDLPDIDAYNAVRTHDPRLEPLPHLLLIVDEFTELLSVRSELTDMFVLIGQTGRELGVHMLLASQRIEDSELRDLKPHFAYLLGLHMFAPKQSERLLDNTDAYLLPRVPGVGYIKGQASFYRRFNTAYVSGPAFVSDEATSIPGAEGSLLRLLGTRLEAYGEPNRRIWLPPLADVTTLDGVCGQPEITELGLRLPATDEPTAPLRVPLGLIEDRGVWDLDLDANGGHVAVVGSPQSGKTVLLHTLVTALALTRTPRQVAVYAVDLAGSAGMRALGALPHVGAAAGRDRMERIRRTFEDVRAMLDHREQVFRTRGITSVAHLRALHEAGDLRELPVADVVVVVDGIGAVRDVFEQVEDQLVHLTRYGGRYGVHVVATMLRRNNVSPGLRSGFGTVVELWRNDPSGSSGRHEIVEPVRRDPPGRALIESGVFARVALPRVDGVTSTADLEQATERTARAVREVWPGDPVPAVRMLPRRLLAAELPDTAREPRRVPIGVDETGVDHACLALFDDDRNLLALGDDRCGKTNLLRLIARGLMDRHPAERLAFVVMDPRGGLRHAIPDTYLDSYAGDADSCAYVAAGVTERLLHRAAGQRGSLSRTVVLIDDYEMLTLAGRRQPLTAFVPHLTNPDLGLHFVVARRVSGANSGLPESVSRDVIGAGSALYEPFMMALRQSGVTGLVMSGEYAEGPLLSGVYASPLPPGRGWWARPGRPTRLVQTALLRDDTRRVRTLLAIEVHRSPLPGMIGEMEPRHDLDAILDRCESAMTGRMSWTRRSADGRLLVELPDDADAGVLVDELPRTLERLLADVNAGRPAELRTRLRAALHCAPAGSASPADFTAAASLVNADPLRDLLRAKPGLDLALLMSDPLHRELTQEDPGALDRNRFVPTAFYVNGLLNRGFVYEGRWDEE